MVPERQFRTPLFDALVALAEARKVSFHTPGHKSGKGISTRFRKFVGSKIFTIDLTTLDEVDCLQKPVGVIREAQELAAEAHGADRSFFLVNGTTVGNHAMILSTVRPGGEGLVARHPPSAVDAGADLTVQSTHKIVGGMTQASMLHVKGAGVDAGRVAGILQMLQSTSPSYILLASLDLARMQMATEGRKLLGKAIDLPEEALDR